MGAEQVALADAHLGKDRDTDILAVATVADIEVSYPPCGACRQTMLEINKGMIVVIANLDGACEMRTIESLLPFSFSNDAANLTQSHPEEKTGFFEARLSVRFS